MNKSERFKVLLERGYFPEELPPPFTRATLQDIGQSFSNHGLRSG